MAKSFLPICHEIYSRCESSGPRVSLPEDRDNMFLRNVGAYNDTASSYPEDIIVEQKKCWPRCSLCRPYTVNIDTRCVVQVETEIPKMSYEH